MAFLKLNQIEIPVLVGSASDAPEEIGDRSRAFDGSMRVSRLRTKDVYTGKVTIQNPEDAEAIRGLILGLGHRWSFDRHLYSSKGAPVYFQDPGVACVTGAGEGRFLLADGTGGKLYFADPGEQIGWNVGLPTPGWSYMVSKNPSGTAGWQNYIYTSNLDAWIDGVPGGGFEANFTLDTEDGSRIFRAFSDASNDEMDEIVYWPFVIPDAWVAIIHNKVWSDVARLNATGNMIRNSSAEVVGKIGGRTFQPITRAGVFYPNAQEIDFQLEEV